MKNMHLLVRGCVIGISIAHLTVFASLFFPLIQGQPPVLSWYTLVQLWDELLRHDLSTSIVFVVLSVVLILPPLAAWAVSRVPGKRSGLLGLWVSLPLTLLPVLGYLILVFEYGHTGATRASWILPIGFGLSFLLCLTLILCLPLLYANEQVAFRSERLEEEESGEHFCRFDKETRPVRAEKDFRLPIFASLGLLSHLFIFQSLFWTYIDYYDVYEDTDLHPYGQGCCLPTPSTGWHLLSQAFLPRTGPRTANMPPLSAPLAMVLLAALVLPALIYLICLMLFPLKKWRKDTRLRKSLFFGYLLTIIGLSLSCFCLMLSLISHGEQPIQNTYPAFVIPPAAFLLSLVCSGLLIKSFEPAEKG